MTSRGGPAGPILALINPRLALVLALLALAGWPSACSHKPPPQAVLEPARVDLSRFGTLGLVEFESGAVDGFGAAVSREYFAALQAAQPGTPVLELGEPAKGARPGRRERRRSGAVAALGAKY